MTNVTMKAADTLHISSVQADSIVPNGEFEVSSAVADDLESRGLATRVGGAKKADSSEPAEAPVPVKVVSAASAKKPVKRKAAK